MRRTTRIMQKTNLTNELKAHPLLWILFAFFLILALSSCAPISARFRELKNRSIETNRYMRPYELTIKRYVGPLTLYFPPDIKTSHLKLLVKSAQAQFDRYEQDNGPSNPCNIFYFDVEYLISKHHEGQLWGLFYGPVGPIHLVYGPWLESSALYHELVHLNFLDYNHLDPRWESFWNPRWRDIRREIINDIRWDFIWLAQGDKNEGINSSIIPVGSTK